MNKYEQMADDFISKGDYMEAKKCYYQAYGWESSKEGLLRILDKCIKYAAEYPNSKLYREGRWCLKKYEDLYGYRDTAEQREKLKLFGD